MGAVTLCARLQAREGRQEGDCVTFYHDYEIVEKHPRYVAGGILTQVKFNKDDSLLRYPEVGNSVGIWYSGRM